MKRSATTILMSLLLTAPASAQSEPNTPGVQEIVEKANLIAYYQGADGRADVQMTIVEGGQTQNRQFTILRRDEPRGDAQPDPNSAYAGDQKYYVYFHRPADVNRTVFLVHKHVAADRDDDRWLYVPALDLVKRISAADKRTSFVGSHFFYEDVSGRNINLDTHELRQVTDHYYILRNTPKDPRHVEFAYYDMYILRSNFLPVYVMFYDAQGRKYRQYEVVKWDKDPTYGYPTVQQARMRDLRTGGYTDLKYTDIEYNVGLPEDIFTERYLRRAPREYLR